MKRHAGILKGLWMLTGLVMLLVMAALAQKNPSVKSIELPADNPTAKLEPGPGADSAELIAWAATRQTTLFASRARTLSTGKLKSTK